MVNSSDTLTLYVDGACRGNPGVGGWGALIINDQGKETELYGGEVNTTNNRMELSAAIHGIQATAPTQPLIIYTDSVYVQKGMTEWIKGWKAKNWKNSKNKEVENKDLWQQLDQVATSRQIEWKWIKGHAGHAGNERADQLANLGADDAAKKKHATVTVISDSESKIPYPSQQVIDEKIALSEDAQTTSNSEHSTALESDWLVDDPLGLADMTADEVQDDASFATSQQDSPVLASEMVNEHMLATDPTPSSQHNTTSADIAMSHPHIKITPAQQHSTGERMLILDTETTGFYYQDGDRIIEVGALEMINRRLTGSSIHIYINPEKAVGESENIHGISDDFLADKPVFGEISSILYDYLKGAEIVAHNATFDMNFLDAEFDRAGLGKLSAVCAVTDTLLIAKRKHPGQKNSLDALVKRYEIPPRDRTFHGALLDAEILADVYLAMTGGQVSLDIDQGSNLTEPPHLQSSKITDIIDIPLILPHDQELQAHIDWLEQYNAKSEQPCLFGPSHKS